MSQSMKPAADWFETRRSVILGGKIDDDMMNKIRSQLFKFQNESNEEATIFIDSSGGSTFGALDLCSWIEHVLTIPIRAIVLGDCSSAATFILLHCNKRMCSPYSRFVIHSGTYSGVALKTNETSIEEVERLLIDMRTTQNMMIEMYARKLGTSKEEVLKLIDRGDKRFNQALTAEEALKMGLVHSILDGKEKIFTLPQQ